MLGSIILFFAILIGLGVSTTFFLKKEEFANNSLERKIMIMGFGLGAVPILIIILNTLKIPLDWRIFLGVSWIIPLVLFIKSIVSGNFKLEMPKLSFKIRKSDLFIYGAIALSFVLFMVYLQGSFSYPWLEDGDPWEHAQGIKYVSEMKTYSQAPEWSIREQHAHYLEPYDPTYDSFLGIMHQTEPRLEWTMKFFNCLIIAIGHLLFYFFAKEFFKSEKKGLLATFLIVTIPCFMSHFIWAQSLTIALFFPAFYGALKSSKNKKWIIPTVITIASLLVTQASNAFIFGILFGLLWLVKSIIEKNFNWNIFISGGIGLILALSLFYIPAYLKFGHDDFLQKAGLQASLINKDAAGAGGGVLYVWKDFWSSDLFGKIDNAVGFGKVFFGILVLSLILIISGYIYRAIKKKQIIKPSDMPIMVSLIWLLFSFIGVHGARLPFSLMSYRFWVIIAIPTVLVATQGILTLFAFVKLLAKKKEDLVYKITLFTSAALSILILIITPGKIPQNNIFTKFPISGALIGAFILFAIISIILGLTTQNKSWNKKLAFASLWSIIIIGLLITSALPKYAVQTSQWPPHAYAVQGELEDYAGIKQSFPLNTKIFPYCNDGELRNIQKIIGANMHYPYWHKELNEIKRNKFNMTPEEIHTILKNFDMEYVIFDGVCLKEINTTEINVELTRLIESKLFTPLNKGNAIIMLKVN